MAVRTSASEVKEIVKTSLTEDQVQPFITVANLLITAKCSSLSYTAEHLREMERWLSAHFLVQRDPTGTVTDKTVGEAREVYQRSKSQDLKRLLESTPYGQQVLLLDYLGGLSALGGHPARFVPYGPGNDDFTGDE